MNNTYFGFRENFHASTMCIVLFFYNPVSTGRVGQDTFVFGSLIAELLGEFIRRGSVPSVFEMITHLCVVSLLVVQDPESLNVRMNGMNKYRK